jgi:hypothetical protein
MAVASFIVEKVPQLNLDISGILLLSVLYL